MSIREQHRIAFSKVCACPGAKPLRKTTSKNEYVAKPSPPTLNTLLPLNTLTKYDADVSSTNIARIMEGWLNTPAKGARATVKRTPPSG
jgi:hypothetical protein